jgi:hypothetical protein
MLKRIQNRLLTNRIRISFESFGKKIFDCSLSEYLEIHDNRHFICVVLEESGLIVHSSKPLPREIIKEFHTSGFHAKAGYVLCRNIPNKPSSFNADLLLISSELFRTTKENYAPIIFHETCHWIILAEIDCPLKTDVAGQALAKELHSRIDPDDRHHDHNFCLLLANASIKASHLGVFNGDPRSVILSAMKYEQLLPEE